MKVSIPWIWFNVGLFLLIELGLLGYFSSADDRHRAVLLFLATVIAGAFALYSFLKGIEEHRISQAGKMMERWNAPDRVAIRIVMADVTDGNFDLEKIRRRSAGHKFDDQTHALRIQILSGLNFYEELAIGIFEKSIDNERCFRFFNSMADQTWTSLADWIQSERNLDRNQTYYQEFEKLIKGWRERRSR
jgi:hypothetical protein